ncbi:ABC transporter permease [bacterium]|nr:ABC transporter permease [bacterium]
MKRIGLPRSVWISIAFIGVVFVSSLVVPFVASPNALNLAQSIGPEAPSLQHPLGTDDLGRDIMVRLLDGARISLTVAFVSMVISIGVGTVIGLIAGFNPGWADELLMRTVDFLIGLPSLFIILIVQVIFSPSLFNIMIVIGLTSWMGIARLVRAEIMSVRERPFILAARARGVHPVTLAFRHALPVAAGPIIVAAVLAMAGAILTESVLSFLGLGVQPPQASWGSMLHNGLDTLYFAPWIAISPGIAITLTVLALNFIGEGIRGKISR